MKHMIFLSLMAAAGLAPAAEPVMSIPKMKAPVIDGVVGAEEWKGAGDIMNPNAIRKCACHDCLGEGGVRSVRLDVLDADVPADREAYVNK